MAPEQDITGDEGGARIFLIVAVTVVVLASTLGYVVGANSAGGTVRVLGMVTLPGTGLAIAVYGLVLSGTILAVLLISVAAASRLEA